MLKHRICGQTRGLGDNFAWHLAQRRHCSVSALIASVCAVSGSTKHSWLRADDDTVRQKLEAALRHAQGELSPLEILGSPPPGEARTAFLNLTKTYHPTRFGRRPEDIRRLANEVYILLKEAFDDLKIAEVEMERAAADKRLRDAKAKATTAVKGLKKKPESPQTPDQDAAPDPGVVAARQAMKNRRKERLMKGGTGKRTAQVRAATDQKNAKSDSEKGAREEQSFERALNQMRIADFTAAAATFKELAIGRPAEKRYRLHMHYAQGRVQQALGQHDEARAEYKRALGLDADFLEAHKAMETLPSGESTAKSLLKKFFKK